LAAVHSRGRRRKLLLPGGGLGDEASEAVDAAVEALAGEDADLDFESRATAILTTN
jgi:hypothetical protein